MRFKITVIGENLLEAIDKNDGIRVEVTDELPHDWEHILEEVVTVDSDGESWEYEHVVGAKVVIDVPISDNVANMMKRIETKLVKFCESVSWNGNEDIPWIHVELCEVDTPESVPQIHSGEPVISICMPHDNWL